jgi:hypothetical protein
MQCQDFKHFFHAVLPWPGAGYGPWWYYFSFWHCTYCICPTTQTRALVDSPLRPQHSLLSLDAGVIDFEYFSSDIRLPCARSDFFSWSQKMKHLHGILDIFSLSEFGSANIFEFFCNSYDFPPPILGSDSNTTAVFLRRNVDVERIEFARLFFEGARAPTH